MLIFYGLKYWQELIKTLERISSEGEYFEKQEGPTSDRDDEEQKDDKEENSYLIAERDPYENIYAWLLD